MCETTALLQRRPAAMADLLRFVVTCRDVARTERRVRAQMEEVWLFDFREDDEPRARDD